MSNLPNNEIDEEVTPEQIFFVQRVAQILDVISEYTEVRLVDGKYECKCPFEDSDEFQMRILTKRENCNCCDNAFERRDEILSGNFICYSCTEGGDVFRFIEKLKGISFLESVKYLANQYGYNKQNEKPL